MQSIEGLTVIPAIAFVNLKKDNAKMAYSIEMFYDTHVLGFYDSWLKLMNS